MFRKSSGLCGRYVQVTDAVQLYDAVQSQRKVVCNWYSRQQRRPLSFLYGAKGGVSDTAQYNLKHVLALVELDFVAETERYVLRDSAQETASSMQL